MFYATLKDKPEGAFKRLTGVRPTTFLDLCAALENHLPSGGRAPKLCVEDRLLLTLMYWREYRTQAHIGETYGISESTVCRTTPGRGGASALGSVSSAREEGSD